MKKKINSENLSFELLKKEEIDLILELEQKQNISILSKKTILDELSSDTSKYYVVKYHDIIVGYVNIYIVIDTIDINAIVVRSEFKRQGIATYMFENILTLCRKLDIHRILLEVRKSNLVAQNLYSKLGFKNIYTRKNYYKDNLEDAYILEFKL